MCWGGHTPSDAWEVAGKKTGEKKLINSKRKNSEHGPGKVPKKRRRGPGWGKLTKGHRKNRAGCESRRGQGQRSAKKEKKKEGYEDKTLEKETQKRAITSPTYTKKRSGK